MSFWTDATQKDPKRAYRFAVSIGADGFGGTLFYAKKCSRPKFTTSEIKHAYMGYEFYFPGRVSVETITLTVVDITNPDVSASIAKLLRAAGYVMPGNANSRTTIGKNTAVAALNNLTIEMLDSGGKVLEEWSLRNVWVKDVHFSELDYTSDELSYVDLTLRYDWAELKTSTGETLLELGQGDSEL